MNSFNYGISINILAKNYNCLWNTAKILNLFDETDENNKTCNYFSSWSLPLPAPSPCVHVRNWKRKPPNKHNKFWLFVAHKQMIQIDRTHSFPFPFPVAENGHKNQRKGECSIHYTHVHVSIQFWFLSRNTVHVSIFSYASLQIQFSFNLLWLVVYFVSINYHKMNLTITCSISSTIISGDSFTGICNGSIRLTANILGTFPHKK